MTDNTPQEVPPSQPLPSQPIAPDDAPVYAAPTDASPGYVSPVYGAPGYGAPAYAAAPPTALSISSFVLGLVSIFFGLLFFVPLAGLVLGILGVKREPTGRGFAIAGIWINAVVLGLVVLGVIFVVVAVAIFGAVWLPYLNQVVENPNPSLLA
jgi:hypothetical protein